MAGQIIDLMPSSGVEQAHYLLCLARYLSLRGEKAKSAQAFEESEQVGKVKERGLTPSTAKAIKNGSIGFELDDIKVSSVDPKRPESDVTVFGDDIVKVLRSLGFPNPKVEQDPRANRIGWFFIRRFHWIAHMDCTII